MRQPQHRNVHPGTRLKCMLLKLIAQRILRINVHGKIRHHAQHRLPDPRLQLPEPRRQNRGIAPELVDDEPGHPRPLLLRQQHQGADKLCKDAARIDVPHQQHGGIRHFREPHIHDILLLQVDLRRAPCALDDDNVIFRRKLLIGRHDLRHQALFEAEVLPGPHVAAHPAVHDNLRAHIRGGLQQNGIHQHRGFNAGGLRLYDLRPAHFQPLLRDEGVERHILGFKGCHPVAVLMQDPAQPRRNEALPRIAHGALNHDGFCHARHLSNNTRLSSCLPTQMR